MAQRALVRFHAAIMARTAPTLSVIIPTFRREKELSKAAQCILAETRIPLEVLVSDDSPEGSARPVIEAIGDPRLRYHHRAVPTGGLPAVVRNEAAKLVTGRFLYFLDDDDRPEPDTLLRMMRKMDELSVGVGMGAVDVFTEKDDPKTLKTLQIETKTFEHARKILASSRRRFTVVARLLFQPTITTCGANMIRRECFESVGGFNTTIPLYEDVDMYLRAIRRFGFAFVDDIVLHRRTGHASLINDEIEGSGVTAKSYGMIYDAYRAQFGATELLALKALAKAALPV